MQATLTTKVQVVPARHMTAPSFISYVLGTMNTYWTSVYTSAGLYSLLLVVCITVLLYLS